MTRRHFLPLFVLAGCMGCQSQYLRTANQDLERENFQLEQRVDQLTWELADAKAALQAYQNGARGPLVPATPVVAPAQPRGRFEPAAQPPTGGGGDQGPPRVELPDEGARAPRSRRREPVPRFTGPPIISPPNPDMPEGQLSEPSMPPVEEELQADARRRESSRDDAPTYRYEETDDGRDAPPGQARLVSRAPAEPVSSLLVNPRLTVWRRRAGDVAGDKGLKLVVEPHGDTGALVPARGAVAVAVLDPSQEGQAARLARWDFPAEEVEKHFRGTQPGGGLHFVLAWPAAAPASEDLLLFVRLTTPEGQQFVAEYALRPDPDDDQASWSDDAEAEQDRPLLTAARQSGSVGWQRATRPIDPREPPVASPNMDPVDDSEVPESGPGRTSANPPAGPSWMPYR